MKVLVGTAITIAAAVGVAAIVRTTKPASADPSAFNALSCNCPQTVPNDSSPVGNRIKQGIQDGLLDAQGIEGQK